MSLKGATECRALEIVSCGSVRGVFAPANVRLPFRVGIVLTLKRVVCQRELSDRFSLSSKLERLESFWNMLLSFSQCIVQLNQHVAGSLIATGAEAARHELTDVGRSVDRFRGAW